MKKHILIVVSILVAITVISASPVLGEGSPMARTGDSTTHGGVLGVGSPTVIIGGGQAWRCQIDFVTCPLITPPSIPHVGGYAIGGSSTVLINGYPAAYQGCIVSEATSTSTIAIGCPTVLCSQ